MYERPVTIYDEVASATSSGHKKTGPRARVSGTSKSQFPSAGRPAAHPPRSKARSVAAHSLLDNKSLNLPSKTQREIFSPHTPDLTTSGRT